MDTDSDRWLKDIVRDGFIQMYRLEEVLYSGRTKYQEVLIARLGGFGLSLVLDGKIQSTELDEYIYHESLVNPAMILHPCPEKIFIAGGGEGATLRDVLKHKTAKKAVMVDIDEEVTALCRRYLPAHSAGAFEDSRATVYHTDARGFLEQSPELFDVMIIDLPDPIEGGPAYRLFTQEFYRVVFEHLKDEGVIAVQAGSASPGELLNLTAVHRTLATIFPVVKTFTTYMPCFGGAWGFTLASKGRHPENMSVQEVDHTIEERGLIGLRHYDGITHQNMFSLPRYIRKAITEQQRIITDAHPLYLHEK